MLDRKFLLGTTVIAGLAAAALVGPTVAMAQTTAPAATTTADDEEEEGDVSALVITGSRIKKNEFSSAAPIQVITSEQSSLEGLVDTAEILQQSSVASGSFQVNNNLTGFVVDGGPGVNTISLRGLGANRTLVLLNGRRVGPAGVRGTVGPVDLNVIPNSQIDRVEILKDGASSIYGSDAIAGVVNIITKTNLDGFEIGVFGRGAEERGGEYYRLNGTYGKTFDRGYFNVALDYSEQKALLRGDRDYLKCSEDYLQAGGRGGGRIDYTGLDGNYKCYNVLNNVFDYPQFFGGFFQYRQPGITYPTTAGTQPSAAAFGPLAAELIRSGRAGFPESFPYANYDSPIDQRRTVISPAKRTTFSATAGFDLTPTVEIYGEFLYNKRESEQSSVRQLFPAVADGNPNNPAVGFGYTRPIIAVPYAFTQDIDYTRFVGGIRGDFGSFMQGWDWDVSFQYTKSDGEYTGDIIYNDRVLAATASNTLACDDSYITVSDGLPGGSCATLPAGGIPWTSARVLSGNFTDAEKLFLFANEKGTTTYEQAYVEGTMSGDLFSLPAGPVGAAVGFQLRSEKLDDKPGITSATYNIWGLTSAGRTKGDDTIKEVFGELAVPVFKGLPGIEALDLSLSARYTDYDSYGSNSTYKAGVNWQIVPALRLRATYGTSFRAPALYELNLGGQTGFLGQTSIDPCIRYENSTDPRIQANCALVVPANFTGGTNGSALIQTFGGSNLKAEESKAYTLGVVWSPSFMDLNVAIDYFDINVDDEVTRFGAGNIVNQCYKSSNYPTNPYCSLFTRGDASVNFGITYVNDSYTNIAKQKNRGIDLTYRYIHEFDFGRLSFDGQFTWQLEDVTTLLLGSDRSDYNGTTNGYDGPDFTGQMNLRFDRGDWTVNWSIDMVGKGSDTEVFGGDTFLSTRYGQFNGDRVPVYYKQYAEFTATHDISVRKKFDDLTLTAGITNIFNDIAPNVSTGQFRVGTAALNQYDIVGRSLFINVTKRW